MSKLIGISRSKYRMVVSDILPYERPIFFTNRFFVRFLKYYGIVCRDGKLIATKNQCDGLEEFLSVLGGENCVHRPAYQYTIAKNSREIGRRLTVIHPFHQIQMVDFYDRYKSVIVDFCQRSRYSIRFPYKIAAVQKKPKGYPKYLSDESEKINSEESFKHFFAYKYYHNINDFYDDYRFLRAEKKYALMEKTDLEHCFDSIRQEMLSEAMFGCPMSDADDSMPKYFYLLNKSFENKPENGNIGEGIVIGPEFSRIFAEIIMQRADVECDIILENEGIVFNRDYVFYRYVDDGFLFCKNEEIKNRFNEVYESCLGRFGLKRGDSENKNKHFFLDKRPFIKNVSAGKRMLINLVSDAFENRLMTFKGFKKIQAGVYDTPTALNYQSFILSVRAIVKTYDLEYKDVMSCILGMINKRLKELLGEFNILYKQYCQAEYLDDISEKGLQIKQQYEYGFIDFLNNLIEVLFYLFSCDSRMSTSIKIVNIINILQLYVRGKYRFSNGDWSTKFRRRLIDEFDEQITDLTKNLFSNLYSDSCNIIETFNFLELQKCMSASIQIHPRKLIELEEKIGEKISFFSVFQVLHFIKNDVRYSVLKDKLMNWVELKIAPLYEQNEISDTENVLTFFETLCCPWVDQKKKEQLVDGFKQFNAKQKKKIISFTSMQKDLFVKWRDYNILEEMQHINNTEVY